MKKINLSVVLIPLLTSAVFAAGPVPHMVPQAVPHPVPQAVPHKVPQAVPHKDSKQKSHAVALLNY